jgi:5-methylcytosine-specific restriction endonuclease McrA
MNWTRKHWKAYEDDTTKDSKRFFDDEQRRELMLYALGKCQCCGRKDLLEFDHILPHCVGGKTIIKNGQVLCYFCNSKKSSNIITLQELKQLI